MSVLRARVQTLLRVLGILAFCVGYPIMAHLAAQQASPSFFGALVALLPFLAIGLYLAWRAERRALMLGLFVIFVAALWWQQDFLISHYSLIYLLQHAGMQGLLCITFWLSLRAGKVATITRFASLVHSHMSPSHLRYTRQVTAAWTIFFGLMTLASLVLFVATPLTTWSTFANFLTPVLITAMFVAEYAVRCRVIPTSERGTIADTIRSIRHSATHKSTPPPTH